MTEKIHKSKNINQKNKVLPPGPRPKNIDFPWKNLVFYGTAAHPQRTGTRGGKDNSAPAEDLHNKNPSLVAFGNKKVGIQAPGPPRQDLGRKAELH